MNRHNTLPSSRSNRYGSWLCRRVFPPARNHMSQLCPTPRGTESGGSSRRWLRWAWLDAARVRARLDRVHHNPRVTRNRRTGRQVPRRARLRQSPADSPAVPVLPTAAEKWLSLRQGARNVAGVTYQVAVTADLLVGGVADRPGHPRVVSVFPEAWEDIDVNLREGGKLFVQAKERATGSAGLGAAAVADAIVHAAQGMSAAGELDSEAHIAVVTDSDLASGLVLTGWTGTVLDRTEPGPLRKLQKVLQDRLAAAGLDPALSGRLLRRTCIVHRPWNHSEETQRDLGTAFSVHPAIAWLAFTVLVERAARIAAAQRSASAGGARSYHRDGSRRDRRSRDGGR
jgi:hypothetical protein